MSEAAKKVGQLGMVVPAGQEDVASAGAADRLQRVLALPLAGKPSTSTSGGRARSAVWPR